MFAVENKIIDNNTNADNTWSAESYTFFSEFNFKY